MRVVGEKREEGKGRLRLSLRTWRAIPIPPTEEVLKKKGREDRFRLYDQFTCAAMDRR